MDIQAESTEDDPRFFDTDTLDDGPALSYEDYIARGVPPKKDASFMKADTDKPMVSLIETEFLLGLAQVLTFGAKKYDVDNWKKGASANDTRRIKDSLLRHTLAYIGGERFDPETGLSHLYHMTCNNMFLDYFDRTTDADSL